MEGVDHGKQYWDDVSGKTLNKDLVVAARQEEIREAERMKVWKNVPRTEAYSKSGRAPIGTRWVDTDKGDKGSPKVRCRLVAQEIRGATDHELFVATPPVGYIKYLLSKVASTQSGKEKGCLMLNDVKKAFFYAPAQRDLYVELPPEAPGPGEDGMCGKLLQSLYGTRDAAANWAQAYTKVLLDMGFVKGASSPCTFYHPGRDICLAVHGDDFVSAGTLRNLQWLDGKFKASFEIKTEILGEDEGLQKEARLLNRIITWRHGGVSWEPDPRHCELVWKELGLDPKTTKPLMVPGVRESAGSKGDNKEKGQENGDVYVCQECNLVHQFGEYPKESKELSGTQDLFNLQGWPDGKK